MEQRMREELGKPIGKTPLLIRLAKLQTRRKAGQKLSSSEQAEIDHFLDPSVGASERGVSAVSYDSIASAAAALKVSKDTLRKAKRDGAPGFRGSRVYPADLLPWLDTQHATRNTSTPAGLDKDSLERKFLAVRIEKLEFDFAIHRKDYILASEAGQWAADMVAEFANALDGLPPQLAPDLVGLGAVGEVEHRLRAAIDQVKLLLHAAPWGAGK